MPPFKTRSGVKVAAVQFQTRAERGTPEAHDIVLEETRTRLEGLEGYGLDLVVLGEGVGAVGQTPEQAESLSLAAEAPGPFLLTYMDFARKEKAHVAGHLKTTEAGRVYNSVALVGPGGDVLGRYHKTFLTAGEIERGLASGKGPVVIDTSIGRLGFAICFDLNFESLRKGYAALAPDIVVFASMYHGGLVQALWAYECRAYFVSALPFAGCGVIDPFGRPVKLSDEYTKTPMARINLDYVMVHLDQNRGKFPEILRKYGDEVDIDIPPHVGPALIYSLGESRTAVDIAKEFELELLDDYFARSREANEKNR